MFGVSFEQRRHDRPVTSADFSNIVSLKRDLPAEAVRDMSVAWITLKYTQSNSVCFVKDGQTIGVGAGQQSRVHCVRLAGGKADLWYLRQQLSDDERRAWLDGLSGVTLGSDAFFPFRDSLDRAAQSGVRYVLEPGGSNRDEDVMAACNEYSMTMVFTGVRLFHH